MAEAPNARQQIVDKIKDSANILVTVGQNPSVDELSAALGLTMMLNKLGKHGTAVMSGAIPPAITFLDPEKTFENTVDSLRDFIIALDKEKADHLRYKVDGDVVKIFITPYRTTIGESDLEFSQGDYNVELVLALGVKDEAQLDTALEAHGRILHDATVATIDNEGEPSSFGSIDWRDETASSLCEMLVSLSEAIKGDKPLLDEQISTALLTGIVAATDRFSNERTSSKVMTMSAQLMAAGANQQLIAAKLEDANAIRPAEAPTGDNKPQNSDGTTTLEEGASTKLDKSAEPKPAKEKKPHYDGSLEITHENKGDYLDEVARQVSEHQTSVAADEATDKLNHVESKPSESKPPVDAAKEAEEKLAAELKATVPGAGAPSALEPSFGGTLNATTEQAAEDARDEEDRDRNKTLLSHDKGHERVGDVADKPHEEHPFNSNSVHDADEPAPVDPFIETPVSHDTSLQSGDPGQSAPETSVKPSGETLADLDAKTRQPHEDPRAAIDAAFETIPSTPTLPPLPDLSTLPPIPPPLDASETIPQPPIQTGPPVGAVPADELANVFQGSAAATDVQSPAGPSDPGEFKIPGQS